MSEQSPAQTSAGLRTPVSQPGALSDDSIASRKSASKTKFQADTKITGVLKDLEDDIVNSAVALHMGSDIHKVGGTSHLSGIESVYVEHNGKFTKAPKKMLSEYQIKHVYEEEQKSKMSPLDTAIWMQKTWTKLAKLCLGFLGGLSLMELIFILELMPSNLETRQRFFEIYPFMDSTISCLMLVFLLVTLVVLFDWIDLGHFQMVHVGDSITFKKIVLIIVLLFSAYVLLLCNRPMDDSFFLHESPSSNFSYNNLGNSASSQNLKHVLINWEFLCIGKDCLIIIAWVLLILSKNEDLFLLHLVAMKKYDYRPEQTVRQNGVA